MTEEINFSHTGKEFHLMRELIRTYQVLMSGFSSQVGVSASQFTLMRLLVKSDREMGVMELSRKLGINAAAVTRQVKALESRGFLSRIDNERDRRRVNVKLTQEGWKLAAKIHMRGHELENSLAEVIEARDIETAVKVLQSLRTFIEGQLEGR